MHANVSKFDEQLVIMHVSYNLENLDTSFGTVSALYFFLHAIYVRQYEPRDCRGFIRIACIAIRGACGIVGSAWKYILNGGVSM